MTDRRPPPAGARVNLTRLPPRRKRDVWAGIQRHRPHLAALIEDPTFQEMRRVFNAEIEIAAEDMPPETENNDVDE